MCVCDRKADLFADLFEQVAVLRLIDGGEIAADEFDAEAGE